MNEVTPELFSLAPDAPAMAAQQVPTVQRIIQPIGLAPTKAKNLVAMAQLLLERHGGQVPQTFEELEALPGVGHKTASVVMAQAFGQPAFPVDTHIHRLAERWGLSSGKSVEQTEADLKVLMPQDTWCVALRYLKGGWVGPGGWVGRLQPSACRGKPALHARSCLYLSVCCAHTCISPRR